MTTLLTPAHSDEDDVGVAIVRRFTDQLNGDTELERITKSAQEASDEAVAREDDVGRRRYYENTTEDFETLDFGAAEVARNELREICEKMIQETKPSLLTGMATKVGSSKKPVKATANEIILNSAATNFIELHSLVESYEAKWKSNHGPIYRNLKRICRRLDTHKQILEIFPQQSIYASVLCGGISLIIQASANHDEIAETLTSTVSEISEEVSLCLPLLDLFRTVGMRDYLSRLYALIFRFYRDAIEWYLKSSRSKLPNFLAFNENVKKRFEHARSGIDKTIERMFKLAQIGGWAMQKEVTKADIYQQRQAPSSTANHPGFSMLDFLRLMQRYHSVEPDSSANRLPSNEVDRLVFDVTDEGKRVPEVKVRPNGGFLKEFIIGDEGHTMISTDELWLPDIGVTLRLQEWMTEDETSRFLWMCGPPSQSTMTSAQAAAMSAVMSAWKTEVPIISHFCDRPQYTDDPMTSEQAGLIGLLYSLISQLLQFKVEGDQFDDKEISEGDITKLDGSENSYPEALRILHRLLQCTPQVKFCVIHNLNALEWGDESAAVQCHDLLDELAKIQALPDRIFQVLLTTSGNSRVLAERVDSSSHCYAEMNARQVYLRPKDVEVHEDV